MVDRRYKIEKMKQISTAIHNRDFDRLQRIIEENPKCVHIKNSRGWTPLDIAISYRRLEMAQFLFEKGGRPNLENYRDRRRYWDTPVHRVAQYGHTAILKWIFTEDVLPLRVLNIESFCGYTPMDDAISCGKLEAAQFLFEKGGRPNLENYCDDDLWLRGAFTPVHKAVLRGHTAILKWAFQKRIIPLHVLEIEDHREQTPILLAIICKKWDIVTLLRRVPIDPAFLATHCAKRDYQCVLRRLPDELLDMVVDEVATRYGLKVVW